MIVTAACRYGSVQSPIEPLPALGILRLSNKHGKERLERACEKAFRINSPSYKTVKTMLRQRMESAPLRGEPEASGSSEHLGAANVRGRGYYH